MRRRSEKPSIKTLKIDGVDVGAREDETILELAQENEHLHPYPLPHGRTVRRGRLPTVHG